MALARLEVKLAEGIPELRAGHVPHVAETEVRRGMVIGQMNGRPPVTMGAVMI